MSNVKPHPIYVISACDLKNGIGIKGLLPWHISSDLKHFHKITITTKDPQKQNMLVMGSVTWESIPKKYRPFSKRKNVVLCWDKNYKADGAIVSASFEEAFALVDNSIENIFIIGGASVYKQALEKIDLDGIYLTKIQSIFDCDAFFPIIPDKYKKIEKLGNGEENGIKYEFLLYRKIH